MKKLAIVPLAGAGLVLLLAVGAGRLRGHAAPVTPSATTRAVVTPAPPRPPAPWPPSSA